MCTYQTTTVPLEGSGKGTDGWFPIGSATVYFDHPVHALPGHTLNIDFLGERGGARARVAVELDARSATALADAILAAVDRAPADLIDRRTTVPHGVGAP